MTICIFIIFSYLASAWCILGIGDCYEENNKQYTSFTETKIVDNYGIAVINPSGYFEEDGEIKPRIEVENLLEAEMVNQGIVYSCVNKEGVEGKVKCLEFDGRFNLKLEYSKKDNGEYPVWISRINNTDGKIYREDIKTVDFGILNSKEIVEIKLNSLEEVIHLGDESTTTQVVSSAGNSQFGDNRPAKNNPTLNFGGEATINFRPLDHSSGAQSGVVFTNLNDSIPSGVTVSSSKWSINKASVSGGGTDITFYRSNVTFREGSGTGGGTVENSSWFGRDNSGVDNWEGGYNALQLDEIWGHSAHSGTGWSNVTMDNGHTEDCINNGGVDCVILGRLNGSGNLDVQINTRENVKAWSFEVIYELGLTAPILNLPENNSNIPLITQLNWSNETGALTYYLEVDDDVTFASPDYVNASITESTNTTGDTPSGLSDGVWYWRVLANDGLSNSSFGEIRKFTLGTVFQICEIIGDFTTPFVNFTFRDENNNSALQGSIVTSTFNYSLNSDFSNSNQLIFIDLGENLSYAFCAIPTSGNVFVNVDMNYRAIGYPQKSYINSSMNLSSTVFNEILSLTSSLDGNTIIIQVVNAAGQPLSGVSVIVERAGQIIESGITDDAGSVTFFLNPDFTYTFTFSRSGFITFTTSFRPTSDRTVILSTTEPISDNVNTDISFTISPSDDVLTNETFYNFTFDIQSGFFIIQEAGFSLINATSGFIFNSTSCNGVTGCSASLNTTTGNFTEINMVYFWKANDTFGNGTRRWTVLETSSFEGSFTYFKRDLASLGGGLDDFTKALITMFIVLIVVGSLTFISGQTSPLAILGEIFATVFLLNRLDLVPTPIGAIPNFIVIIVGVIFVGYALREFGRLL